MRRAIGLGVVALAGILALGRAPRADDASERVIRGIQAWLDGTRDLTCRFEQRLLSGALGAGASESGTLWVLRPGRMRWDYDAPERKTAIVAGERTWLYLPDDRQLIRGTLSADQDLLPALLAGRRPLADLFSVSVVRVPERGAQERFRATLIPRSAPEGIEEIVLQVHPPAYAIERAEVLDPAGNRIEYLFGSVRRNSGVPDSIFTFEPPPGTEIVESR